MSNDRQRNNARQTKGRIIRPVPTVIAAAVLWAAANEPVSFTPSSIIVWLLGTVTIALLARAALALLEPLIKLGIALMLQGVPRRTPNAGDGS
jgi:hypothetical protein